MKAEIYDKNSTKITSSVWSARRHCGTATM